MRLKIFLAALAAPLLLATAASALDASCLRQSLAPARAADFVRDYRAHGLGDMPAMDDADEGYLKDCGAESNVEEAGRVVALVYLERGSRAVLTEDYGLTEAQLRSAWADLPPPDRTFMTAMVNRAESGAEPTEAETTQVRAIITAVTSRLGTPEAASIHLYAWLMSQAYFTP